MYRRSAARIVALLALLAVAVMGSFAQAQTYYWDTTPGSMTGGSGTWSTTTSYWSTSTSGDASLSVWPGTGYNAEFTTGAGTVTLDPANVISVGNITFDPTTAYSLSGGTINLTSGTITANGNATIGSYITGTAGLNQAGTGVLTLTASNGYTGGTTVSAGALQLGNGLNYNGSVAGNISVASGASLIFANPLTQSFAGNITGSGTLSKTAAGQLTLSSLTLGSGGISNLAVGGGTMNVTSFNPPTSGTGSVYLNGGVFNDADDNFVIPIGATVNAYFNGGQAVVGTTNGWKARYGTINNYVSASGGTITGLVDTNHGGTMNFIFSGGGSLLVNGNLTCFGADTWNFTGNGAFNSTGTTAIAIPSGGLFNLNLSSGTVQTAAGYTVNGGGTLATGGGGTYSAGGLIEVQSGGLMTAGLGSGGVIVANSGLQVDAGGVLNANINGGTIQSNGTFTTNGTSNVTLSNGGLFQTNLTGLGAGAVLNISGPGTFSQTNNGTIYMPGAGTASLNVSGGANASFSAGQFRVNNVGLGATLDLNVSNGTLSLANLYMNPNGGTSNSAAFNPTIGSGGLLIVPGIGGANDQSTITMTGGTINSSSAGIQPGGPLNINMSAGSLNAQFITTNTGYSYGSTSNLNIGGGTIQCQYDLIDSPGVTTNLSTTTGAYVHFQRWLKNYNLLNVNLSGGTVQFDSNFYSYGANTTNVSFNGGGLFQVAGIWPQSGSTSVLNIGGAGIFTDNGTYNTGAAVQSLSVTGGATLTNTYIAVNGGNTLNVTVGSNSLISNTDGGNGINVSGAGAVLNASFVGGGTISNAAGNGVYALRSLDKIS